MNRILSIYLALLFVSLLNIFPLHAQKGLDLTFAEEGKFVFEDPGIEGAWEAVVQKDGKVIIAGWRNDSLDSRPDVLLIRINHDGSIDSTFESGNFITYAPWTWEDSYDIKLLDSGKIIITGRFFNGSDWDFLLIRFNSNGQVDSTFGYKGFTVTNLSEDDKAFSTDIQPDGKIIIGGHSLFNMFDFTILRYNPNGSLDESFGNNGSVVTDFFGNDDIVYSVKVQSDEKIIACGWSFGWPPEGCDFAIVRYNSDGSVDSTFGINGKVTTDIYKFYNSAHSIDIQKDGKYVVAGYTFHPLKSDHDLVVVRYNSDGSLDSRFGNAGIVVTDINGGNELAWKVRIQNNNKIVVSGYYELNSEKEVLTIQYNEDGSLDHSFCEGGYSIINLNGIDEEGRGLALYENEIFVTGYTYNEEETDVFVIKYPSPIMNTSPQIFSSFKLFQNYPNPFNAGSFIEFQINEISDIRIKIFDVLGCEISVLMDEVKQPGHYKIPFTMDKSPSGIYFYQLKSEKYSETKKMLYLK